MLAEMTSQHRKVLRGLSQRSPVIARWDNVSLNWLLNHGLVKSQRAFVPAGSWSANVVWVLSQKGLAFLADGQERG